jgi:mediator of RNA polymerase II transcription subunit 12, fungi type
MNNGLKCITEFLQELPLTDDTKLEGWHRVGQILHILLCVAQPFRGEPPSLLNIDSSVQSELLSALLENLTLLESRIAPERRSQHSSYQFVQELTVVLQLLQFELGSHQVWSPEHMQTSSNLCSLLFKLALVSILDGF